MKLELHHFLLPSLPLRRAVLVCLALIASVLLAQWARPRSAELASPPNLEEAVPRQFGQWKELRSPYLQVRLTTGAAPGMSQPYDQTLMRTYVNSQGQHVMLALAWGQRQSQEVKIHRPDLCYVAQGFAIKSLQPTQFKGMEASSPVTVSGKHMVAMSAQGGEAVAYWIRIGSVYSESAWETRKHLLTEGFAGRIPDGILVRASQAIRQADEAAAAFPQLEEFLAELYAATPPGTRALMVR
jgi:EpsI family protein